MPFDGIFVHFLVKELNLALSNYKINKIYQPNPLDIVLQLRGKDSSNSIINFQLLLSVTLDAPKVLITNQKFVNPANPSNFCMLLRKYIERGRIIEITQYQNDRIIKILVECYNELNDLETYTILVELMGRNSNIILINSDYKIIDAIRRLPPSMENTRLIIPKAQYCYPEQQNITNPFTSCDLTKPLQGCCSLILNEWHEKNISPATFLKTSAVMPHLFKKDQKVDFYCFKLTNYHEIVKEFDSLSALLEYFYFVTKKAISLDATNLIKVVKRHLNHLVNKIDNLEKDLELAKKNSMLDNIGILLQANLYLVKPGMDQITVHNFLTNQSDITISLDKTKSPSDNLKYYFSKSKKAKNAIIKLGEQLELTHCEISYLDNILMQLQFASSEDLHQIKDELNKHHYLKQSKNNQSKKSKINLQKYEIEGLTIYLGKNNLQNEYLTHKVARNNDYWFHVKDAPGSHVIVVIPNNDDSYQMSENVIRFAARLAAQYSKLATSSSVPVDYTKGRFIKKIPAMRGYNVTYTNHKTIYIDPIIS